MSHPYEWIPQIRQLYGLLQDEMSRRLFWDRLRCDVAPSVEHTAALCADAFGLTPAEQAAQLRLGERARALHRLGKRLLLYGAGSTGNVIAEMLRQDGIPFDGFCDRRADALGTVQGKPVYRPAYVLARPEECYVLITALSWHREIEDFLLENRFPQTHILPYFRLQRPDEAYFAFPDCFPRGTAFVDGGCCDAGTSLRFAQWCGGAYSAIFAFEPDAQNAAVCRAAARAARLRGFRLIQAGLGRARGTARFTACGTPAGHVQMEAGIAYDRASLGGREVTIPLVALDDVVGDTAVGFLKLDIEGSELEALRGAERTLRRDRPLLAICVYHRRGDTLAVMEHLHAVVPEYRFWLRHYTATPLETVLYAAVPKP